jgi:hypothetical protein
MAEPSGEHVVRGNQSGNLTNQYNYDATSSTDVAGWSKVDGTAGDVNQATGQATGSHWESENGTFKQV